ncbi:MAG: hypothetical protein AAF363_21000 [Bacteroidota bacterium]
MTNSIKRSLITVLLLGALLFLSLLSFAGTVTKSIRYDEGKGILIPISETGGFNVKVKRSSNSSSPLDITTTSVDNEYLIDQNPRQGANFYTVAYYDFKGALIKEDNYAAYVPTEGSLKVNYKISNTSAAITIENLESKPYTEYVTLEVVGDNLEILSYDLARLPEKDEEIELGVKKIKKVRSLRLYKNNYLISSKNIK